MMMMNKKRKNFYEKENFEPPVKCFPDLKRKKINFSISSFLVVLD
jgi:membrane protein insertase Oxa1/YidC/SpoIIIJ